MYRSSKFMNITRTTISSDALKKVVSDRIAPGFSDNRQDMAIAIGNLRLYSTKTGTVTTETGTSKPNLITRVGSRIFNSKSGNRGLSSIIDFNEESRASQNLDQMKVIFQIPFNLHEQLMKEKDKIIKEKDDKIEKLIDEKAVIRTNLDSVTTMYNELRIPILVRVEIEWFIDTYAFDFVISNDPVYQKIAERRRKEAYRTMTIFQHILSLQDPTIDELRTDISKSNLKGTNTQEKITTFSKGVAILRSHISDVLIHALKRKPGEKIPDYLSIMHKEPFDECAMILVKKVLTVPTIKYLDVRDI